MGLGSMNKCLWSSNRALGLSGSFWPMSCKADFLVNEAFGP